MMRGNSALAKAEGIMERVIGDDIVVLSQRGDLLHTLSDTSRFIWERIDGKRTFNEILSAIVDEYQVDEAVAAVDLRTFIGSLLDESLIVEEKKGGAV
jgi:hypothetical protein